MQVHRYERWWLTFGVVMLVGFLLLIGFAAFVDDINPPSDMQQVDPTKVSQTPPFDKPGLRRLPDGTYEAYYVARVFEFEPARLTIPVGSTVTFYVTSADVVHGFFVPNTDINMMAVPGWVNEERRTFTRPGEYLLICHEYCGIDHQDMFAKIEVR
ncbi:MAG: cytochrome c oxidase subunit II [Candidatus Baltobacteraceae bacterium]